MDFIQLSTEQGAEFLFNIHNITLIDAKNCQLYTVDNPAYGWTLSQKSMDDLMNAVGPHIVAANQPIPAPPAEPPHWDYPLNTAEPVAHVVKEWTAPTRNQKEELEAFLREREERRMTVLEAIKELEDLLWPTN